MSFLQKIFGKKQAAHGPSEPAPAVDPAKDPNMIRVFDGYGREMFITKQQWRENILPGNLEKARDKPEVLYDMLVSALKDGFATDIVQFAEHLHRTDPVPSRSATVLGIVYMDVGRLDDAQRVYENFIKEHGEEGYLLTNLAKVHSRRGDNARAEETLWHALELDPNQENGMAWYVAIQNDRGGKPSALDAYKRIAKMSKSWRAQLWIARDALERKDVAAALEWHKEALSRVPPPIPAEMLMQISGDLGNNGYLAEIISLVGPLFDPALHGLTVGNNLIKANLDTGNLAETRRLIDLLYAQKRPDWQPTLSFWDSSLAKTTINNKTSGTKPTLNAVTMISIEGPLWTRDGSPFAALMPEKESKTQHIAIYGSTVLFAEKNEQPQAQLSDAPGRLSRALPLLLTETIHLRTDAIGITLIPWAQEHGFAVFGRPYEDAALCELAGKNTKPPTMIVSVTINTTQPKWQTQVRILRTSDGNCVADTVCETAFEDPGPGVLQIADKMLEVLTQHAGVQEVPPPEWYEVPNVTDTADYLLRLEQQLAVASMTFDPLIKGGGLSGEHEIIDGGLQLCVRQPSNITVRMLLAQTLRLMKKVRPEILVEYKDKTALLAREHPLQTEAGLLATQTIHETISAVSTAPSPP